MNIYYDSEFLENGVTIIPISIGMVREDGKEYYGITNNIETITRAARHPWLKENVLTSLPLKQPVEYPFPQWDEDHPDFDNVKAMTTIAIEVCNFIRETPDASLWAWFGQYDHVLLAQMYGTMMQLPSGIPMRTNDVAQVAEMAGNVHVPAMPGIDRHNALSDAREVKWRMEWLRNYTHGSFR